MPVQISGVVASLCWGYAQAATLRAWTVVTTDDGGWRLTAAVDQAHTFRVAQRPLVFEAPHATGAWRWPVIELQLQAGALTATLGPREG